MTDLAVVAQGLQEHLRKEISFSVCDKETSDIMKAVAFGMDIGSKFTSGIPTGSSFMTNYATTLGPVVFLPQSIRDNPLSLCEVITHEAQHVLQFQSTGLEFAWFYLTDSAARAQFEADAYASGIAVRCWLTGVVPQTLVASVVASLVLGYHLRPEDTTYAEAAIKSHMASLASGLVMTKSARIALAYLNHTYPELKGSVTA